MFYQSENSLHGDLIKLESGCDFSFPTHLHSSFELITVTEGQMAVTIDKKQYRLTPGEALLVFPNQPHSLQTEGHSKHLVCIFSPQLVRAFSTTFLHKLPDSHRFSPAPFYLERLAAMAGSKGLLQVKGLLYSLCAEFDRTATYHPKESSGADLLQRIFGFVESNYGSDCSLEALAQHTSYHEVYLSRYFKQCTGLTFTEHVNRYRINQATYMLRNTQQKVLDIAYDCGFESLRSFNRNFKKVTGLTPGEYRGGV